MKPVNSLITKHDPENGHIGDCDRACLASLLELTCLDVPHFAQQAWTGGELDGERFSQMKRAWLAKDGYGWIELPFGPCELQDMLDCAAAHAPNHYYTLLGEGKRGFGHVVVAYNSAIVHDPTYGDPHGIVGPIDGYWWLGFLTRLEL